MRGMSDLMRLTLVPESARVVAVVLGGVVYSEGRDMEATVFREFDVCSNAFREFDVFLNASH